MTRASGKRRALTIASRAYTTAVALVCAASVAYAIHANGQAAKADRAAVRAREWEADARATRDHRLRTAHALQQLVRQYNAVARTATADQRRLLSALARARHRAAKASPSDAPPPVEYATTSVAVSLPASAQPAPAAPLAPSTPTTKTS